MTLEGLPSLPHMVLFGFIATVAMTTVLQGAQALGWSRLSLTFLVGTFFSAKRGTAVLVGFCAYVAGGWLFSLLYYWVLAAIGIQTWWMGALLGALHGATLLLAVLPVLPHLHPRMASEYDAVSAKPRLEPPGMLGLNYGPQTPLTTMLAQVVFGTLIGGLPQLAAAM